MLRGENWYLHRKSHSVSRRNSRHWEEGKEIEKQDVKGKRCWRFDGEAEKAFQAFSKSACRDMPVMPCEVFLRDQRKKLEIYSAL